MKEIKNVILCGLGGLGSICATQIFQNKNFNLKILVDESRFEKYQNQKTYFNDKSYSFEYIKPDYPNYKADLVIIATKNDGLGFAIKAIKNFIHKDTIFISLLNGIMSEKEIASLYGWENTLICFYIGNSCIRKDRNITLNGTYKFVIGRKGKDTNIKALEKTCNFFDKVKIKYEISEKIADEYWKKFIINTGINQLSAVTELGLKQIKQNKELSNKLVLLMKEAQEIAKLSGIDNHQQIFDMAYNFLFNELDDAYPSMLQDIKAGRKTEVDIFSGVIVKLSKEYGINTPENAKIYQEIKEKEYSGSKI